MPRRLIACLLTVAAAVPLAAAPTANAGLLTGLTGIRAGLLGSLLYVIDDLADQLLTGRTALSAVNCPAPALSSPFARYGDNADYFLIKGGDFSSSIGSWTAAGGWLSDVGDPSLAMIQGATAVSPKLCVGDEEPTMRLMLRASSTTAQLKVRALFLGTSGELRSDHVATLTGTTSWAPSRIVRLGTNARAARGEKTAIALVFSAERGSWQIDDVYVDPYRSR